MPKYALILFFCVSLFADVEMTNFVLRIAAKKDSVETMHYIYYNICFCQKENRTMILKFDSSTKYKKDENYLIASFDTCYLPDSFILTDTIIKHVKFPFAFAESYKADLSQFDSFRIDSVLWGETYPKFLLLDSTTYNYIMNNNVHEVFRIQLCSQCFGYQYLQVVSFDSTWNSDFFMSQFDGYKNFIKTLDTSEDNSDMFKQITFWEHRENKLNKSCPGLIECNNGAGCHISAKSFPNKIRLAIEIKKILVFLFQEG
mgnify:CR=1 FL=1|jgi:hypothetical protein